LAAGAEPIAGAFENSGNSAARPAPGAIISAAAAAPIVAANLVLALLTG
jgi:hypothetical protein